MGDAPAEKRGLGVFLVEMQRVEIARNRAELLHVGLGYRAGIGFRLSDFEVLDVMGGHCRRHEWSLISSTACLSNKRVIPKAPQGAGPILRHHHTSSRIAATACTRCSRNSFARLSASSRAWIPPAMNSASSPARLAPP